MSVAGTAIVSYTYAEKNGSLTKVTYANGDYFRYEYDSQDRPVKEYYYSAAAKKEQLLRAYVYDKDRLLSWGGTAMTYDACGNLTKKGSTIYTWTQGRKLSAVNSGKSIQYFYDHTSVRTKKIVDGTTTEYRMAGILLVSERTGNATIWYSYDSGANLTGICISGKWYFYLKNAQNDVIGLIDSTGKQAVEYRYDSWGNVISTTGTLASTVGQKILDFFCGRNIKPEQEYCWYSGWWTNLRWWSSWCKMGRRLLIKWLILIKYLK